MEKEVIIINNNNNVFGTLGILSLMKARDVKEKDH